MKHLLFCLAIGLSVLSFCGLPTLSAVPSPMPFTINLWPGLAPGETTLSLGDLSTDTTGRYGTITKLTNVTCPQMIFYPAGDGRQVRPTVLICPGGGYHVVTTDIEGSEIARWLNSLGYNAAVLHYRVPGSQVPPTARRDPAFQDVQRAMTLLRANAAAWGVDAHRLGVIGFSAGGHLAARLACAYPNADWRPDFALLVYPAYLWDEHRERPATEVQPRSGMPPFFLMQTRDDTFFDVEGYAESLSQVGASVHCMVREMGGHGYGLRLSPTLPAHLWTAEAAAWLHKVIRDAHPRK